MEEEERKPRVSSERKEVSRHPRSSKISPWKTCYEVKEPETSSSRGLFHRLSGVPWQDVQDRPWSVEKVCLLTRTALAPGNAHTLSMATFGFTLGFLLSPFSRALWVLFLFLILYELVVFLVIYFGYEEEEMNPSWNPGERLLALVTYLGGVLVGWGLQKVAPWDPRKIYPPVLAALAGVSLLGLFEDVLECHDIYNWDKVMVLSSVMVVLIVLSVLFSEFLIKK